MYQHSWREKVIILLFFTLFVGLVYSHFIQSLSLVLLCIISFFDFGIKSTGSFYIRYSKELTHKYLSVFKYPSFLMLSFFFLYLLIPNQECLDHEYLYERLVIKLPFLFLPAAFLTYPKIEIKTFKALFNLFGLLLIIQFTYLFYSNYQLGYNEVIKIGKSLHTPGNHIRFSLISSFILITNLYFLLFHHEYGKKAPLLQSAGLLTLLIFIHLLLVRTGIVISYLGIIILTVFYIIKRKKYILGTISILLIAISPFIFYKTSSSFKNKIDYMVYDLAKFKEGKGANYADSGRLASINTGLKLFNENKLLGVGNCNIRPKTIQQIKSDYPDYPTNLLPHSQFIFTLAGSGIIGFCFLSIGLLFPFLYGRNFKEPFAIMLLSCFVFLFMIDHLLEGTVGVGIYLFFTLFHLRFLQNEKSNLLV